MSQEFQDRITVDPNVMVGKPVIRGTRIPVELIVRMVARGIPMDEILADYPAIQVEDVQAALDNSSTTATELVRMVDLARSSGLTYLAIFGSAARGEAGPESDMDLAVRFGRRMTLFDLADLQMRFQEILGKPVDLVPVDDIYPFMHESVQRDQLVLLDVP